MTEGRGRRRVFLVDDHDIVRQGLKRLLESEPDFTVCGEAADAHAALAAIPRAKPDVVVCDLGLEDMGGLDLIKALKDRFSKLPVLVVSMFDEAVYGERALHAGAKGYLMKKESSEKILPALRHVLSGKLFMSPALSERMLDRFAQKGEAAASPVDKLSDRELQVLELIGQGLKTGEIAEKLHLSVKTVESYREQIKIKLDIESASALTQYAIQWSHDRHRGR